jgi:hypothetical protein
MDQSLSFDQTQALLQDEPDHIVFSDWRLGTGRRQYIATVLTAAGALFQRREFGDADDRLEWARSWAPLPIAGQAPKPAAAAPEQNPMTAQKRNVQIRLDAMNSLLNQISDPKLALDLGGAIDRLRQADIEFERELAKQNPDLSLATWQG